MGEIEKFKSFITVHKVLMHLVCRFLATEESFAHPTYKKKLVELEATEYTDVFGRARWPGAPQRVLKTPFFMDWRDLPSEQNESNQPIIGRSRIHGIVRFFSFFFSGKCCPYLNFLISDIL